MRKVVPRNESLLKLKRCNKFTASTTFFQQFSTSSRYETLLNERAKDIRQLPEVQEKEKFQSHLESHFRQRITLATSHHTLPPTLTKEAMKRMVTSAILTFLLHVESRVSSLIGEGFYTIGPCGEENMAVLGELLRPTDNTALHYRHLATQITRQLKQQRTVEEICLDRARGHVCSSNDPVTGGRHCALGNPLSENDYYVTSTLASQTLPAVGRALGISRSFSSDVVAGRKEGKTIFSDPPSELKWKPDSISFVSVGDGSVNNGMFHSATNLAEYARHRMYKCPVLFCVTNNELSISLRGYGWMKKFSEAFLMPVYRADGSDIMDLWKNAEIAIDSVRSNSRPAILFVNNVTRRFGHAATDRQNAYLSPEEILKFQEKDVVLDTCQLAVNSGLMTVEEIASIWELAGTSVRSAFVEASNEKKISSREELIRSSYASEVVLKTNIDHANDKITYNVNNDIIPPRWVEKKKNLPTFQPSTFSQKKYYPDILRKLINHTIEEAIKNDYRVHYLGEDVRHGGYYGVTESLAGKYPNNIIDFPPDESSLVGAAMGFSQAKLLPILEIPYAKYLDCAFDILTELCITHWATNKREKPGMVIRLQGFDKGVFGGNYHTHNTLHRMVGLDLVCFSNGRDYMRGLRSALVNAANGRIVMIVDSTDLLNRRHLFPEEKDNLWLKNFQPVDPEKGIQENDILSFDSVMVYLPGGDVSNPIEIGDDDSEVVRKFGKEATKKITVVLTYGNGVVTALRSRQMNKGDYIVVDVPCLTSGVLPMGLVKLLRDHGLEYNLVFADVCKFGGNPLNDRVVQLQEMGLLSSSWTVTAAAPTYNPLGTTLTFLSEEDITSAVRKCEK